MAPRTSIISTSLLALLTAIPIQAVAVAEPAKLTIPAALHYQAYPGDLHYKGVATDPVTGHDFHLYDRSEDSTLQSWYDKQAQNNETEGQELVSRSTSKWQHCHKWQYNNLFGCHADHNVWRYYCKLGHTEVSKEMWRLLEKAFQTPKGPRAVCHQLDDKQLCVSWAEDMPENLPGAHSMERLIQMSTQCFLENMSVRVNVRLKNNYNMAMCFSDRAKKCSTRNSATFCGTDPDPNIKDPRWAAPVIVPDHMPKVLTHEQREKWKAAEEKSAYEGGTPRDWYGCY